jgi:heme-degrading monooxygenase HmoA
MNYLLIRHKVKDYKKWKAAYDAHAPARKAAGLKEHYLLRNTKSRNDVLILSEAANLARAKAFCASPDLRAAMKKAGVTGKPDLSILADA